MVKRVINKSATRVGGELFLHKPYAATRVTWVDRADMPPVEAVNENGIRVYQQSSETVCLQIRTFGPLAEGRNAKRRFAYSSVGLNIKDIDVVCRELQALKARLVPEPQTPTKAQPAPHPFKRPRRGATFCTCGMAKDAAVHKVRS